MGGNAAEAHPCGFKWVTEAKANRGAKLIVVDPRRTDTAEMADLHLPLLPGSDVALCHGLLHAMLWEGWLDARFIAGNRALYEHLLRERRGMVRGHRGWMRNELIERRAALRAKEPWQLLAADLKNGRGGLRDLHAMHWLDAAEAIAEGQDVPPLAPVLEAAHEHHGLIRRFGRFPHRNPVLGRKSTAAELAFLKAGGFAG